MQGVNGESICVVHIMREMYYVLCNEFVPILDMVYLIST